MKENLCYVGYNIEQEQKLALETTVLVESYTVSFMWLGERFNAELHSIKVLTARGAVVSISLKCLRVTVQMSQYVRQQFFWQEFLVCGFTDSPPGHISILCFHGNVLFGWDWAAGKFFSLRRVSEPAQIARSRLAVGRAVKQGDLKGAAVMWCLLLV